MGRLEVTGLETILDLADRLGGSAKDISKKAVYNGAKEVADEIKSRLSADLANSEYSTGELIESLGVAPIQVAFADIDTSVGFDGYDSRGVPNQLKARARESGTSTQIKRPVIRNAVNAVKEKARQAMEDTVAKEIKNIFGG